MPWKCFMVEPTGRQARWLRRYASGSECAVGEHGYHHAKVRVEDGPETLSEDGYIAETPVDGYRDDPRWPRACPCGHEFSDEDVWQVLTWTIYGGEAGEWNADELPPGAMFDAWWMGDYARGEDGCSLSVVLPPGSGLAHVWHVDGPARDGGKWTRSGEPPRITATPSIMTGAYHGFLTDGVLTDSLPDRHPQRELDALRRRVAGGEGARLPPARHLHAGRRERREPPRGRVERGRGAPGAPRLDGSEQATRRPGRRPRPAHPVGGVTHEQGERVYAPRMSTATTRRRYLHGGHLTQRRAQARAEGIQEAMRRVGLGRAIALTVANDLRRAQVPEYAWGYAQATAVRGKLGMRWRVQVTWEPPVGGAVRY